MSSLNLKAIDIAVQQFLWDCSLVRVDISTSHQFHLTNDDSVTLTNNNESPNTASPPLSSSIPAIKPDLAIYKAITSARFQDATLLLSTFHPSLLAHPSVQFNLHYHQLAHILSQSARLHPPLSSQYHDSIQSALLLAKNKVAPMALDAYPEAYGEFKQLMILLLLRDGEEEDGERMEGKKSSKDKNSSAAAAAAADQQQQQPSSVNVLSEMYITARRIFMKLKVIECMYIPHLDYTHNNKNNNSVEVRSFISKMVKQLLAVQDSLSSSMYTGVVVTGEEEAGVFKKQLNTINREINRHFDIEDGELGTPDIDTCWPLDMKLVAARFSAKPGDNNNSDDDKNNKGNLSSSVVVPPPGIPPTPKKATREGRYEFAALVARMVREGLASSLSDSSFSLIMRQLLLVARYNIGTKLAIQYVTLGQNDPEESGVERGDADSDGGEAWCFYPNITTDDKNRKKPSTTNPSTSATVPEPFNTELNVISSDVYRDGAHSYSFEEAYKHITDHIPSPSLGHILPPSSTTNTNTTINNNSGPSSIPTMNIANLRTALLCDTPTAIALLRRQQYKQQQYSPSSSSSFSSHNNNSLFSGTGVTSSAFNKNNTNNQYTTSNWGPRTALIHGIQAIPLHYKGPSSGYGAVGSDLAGKIAKHLLPPPPTMKKKTKEAAEEEGGSNSSGNNISEQRMGLIRGTVGLLGMCIEAADDVVDVLNERDTSINSTMVLIDWLKDLAVEYAEYRGLRHVSPICHLPTTTTDNNNNGGGKKPMCIAIVKTKAPAPGGNAVNRRPLSGLHHNNNRKDTTTTHHQHQQQKLYKLPFLEDEDESSNRERGHSSDVLSSYQGIIIHSSSNTETGNNNENNNEEDGMMCILTPPSDDNDDDHEGRLVTITPHFPDIHWNDDDDKDADVMDIDQTNNNKHSSGGLTSAAAAAAAAAAEGGGGRRKRRDADKSPPTKAARHTISGNCVHDDDDASEEEVEEGDMPTTTATATTINEKIHHVDKLMHSVWTLLSPSSSSLTCDNIDAVVELLNTKQPGLLDTWTSLHFYLLRIKMYIMMCREEDGGGKEAKGKGKGGGGGYDAMEALKLVRTELSPLAEIHKKKKGGGGGEYGGGDEDELRDALKAALIEVLPLKPLSSSSGSGDNNSKEGEMVVMMRKKGRAKLKSEVRRVSCMIRTALLNYNDISQPRLIGVLERLFHIHDEYLAGQRIGSRNSLAMQALNMEAWLGNGTTTTSGVGGTGGGGLLSLPATTTTLGGGGGGTAADAGRTDMEIDNDDDDGDDFSDEDDDEDDDDDEDGQPPHGHDDEEGGGAEFSDDGDDEFPDQWITMTMEFSGLQRGQAIEMLHRYGDPESVLHHLFP